MINNEWLETDGMGGFASGGADTIRSRRYHAILLTATTPPTGRIVLVNGFDAWIQTPTGSYPISSQRYSPDVVYPDGYKRIHSFSPTPWPTWVFELEDGTSIQQEIVMLKGASMCSVLWRRRAGQDCALFVRPFFSGRDYHSLHHENASFRFEPESSGDSLVWKPYSDLPEIHVAINGNYKHEPQWYRNFLYEQEKQRGLDFSEDLASPGVFQWDLSNGPAVCIFSAQKIEESTMKSATAVQTVEKQRRNGFKNRLDFAADAYIVERRLGKTIVAGYPWFTDWGRDTFIALRGLCLARGELQTAKDILVEWSQTVSEGMLPNRFPDQAGEPEYNSVDASLWYIIAIHDYLNSDRTASSADRSLFMQAVNAILDGFQKGTRYGIRMDDDGLLAAGQRGVQLTWMDAKIEDWVITPRIGKPVEIQALWLNALKIAGRHGLYERGRDSFVKEFWNETGSYLYDVVNVDHEPGKTDDSFRPNQILAVGGLPFAILEGSKARSVVDAVETRLVTPLGLRSLAPGSQGYAAKYEGGVRARDSVYHQGTVWPWLIGPFVEAWLRVRDGSADAKREARERFLQPLLQHQNEAGLGHISEIADAESPHHPRGCPFQAWSVSETIRIAKALL